MNDHRRDVDVDASRIRRSQGRIVVARGLWYVKPGEAELRTEPLMPPPPGFARVETEYSAISRGTECLVAHGQIPESEHDRMRAPAQTGNFPFPVKYGYAAAGLVTAGPPDYLGQRAFALHPHQDVFQVATSDLCLIPAGVPTRRAVLAANMETALNAHWDARTAPGDRVLVIGAGIVGLLVAYLAQRIPGTEVVISDINPAKAAYAEALGVTFAANTAAPTDNRLVFHTSATAEGLNLALNACQFEGTVVELSWYGTRTVAIDLGGAFHSKRLRIIASQVGHVAPAKRQQTSPRKRLELALELLADTRLDKLVEREIDFAELPSALPKLWSSDTILPVVRYKPQPQDRQSSP